jgi:hypothetical protein
MHMETPVVVGVLVVLGFLCLANLALTLFKLTGESRIMLELTALTAKVEAIAAVIPNLAKDYETLKAEIEALKAQIDPGAQAAIDALTVKMDAAFSALKTLDETVPAPVVPTPVEPPPAQ